MAAPVRKKAEAERIKYALRQAASPAKAEILASFFKTGRGDDGYFEVTRDGSVVRSVEGLERPPGR